MASGMPSSQAHTCATAAELSADSSKAGLAAAARAANSRPASDAATTAAEPSAGSPSGGTGKTSSPGTSRRSRLVARNRTRGQRASSVAPFGHTQGLRDAGRDQRRIGERGQLDQPGPVPEASLGERRHPQRQPGLAAPARAGQRDRPGRAQAFEHSSYLRAAAHQ